MVHKAPEPLTKRRHTTLVNDLPSELTEHIVSFLPVTPLEGARQATRVCSLFPRLSCAKNEPLLSGMAFMKNISLMQLDLS